jgi:GcrA cell cycle regulator
MPHASRQSPWNDRTIGQLRTLWADGLSTSAIGRRLGVSKNAIVGKAHRLDLPSRPSPVRRDGPRTPPPVRRPRCPRLTDLQAPMRSQPSPVRPPAFVQPPPAPAHPSPAPISPPAPPPIRTAIPGSQPCCWPIGDPGTRTFRFCDAPNQPAKPYCPEHCALAYQKVPDHDAA